MTSITVPLFIALLFSVSLVRSNAGATLVNQTNGYTLYYDLTNRLECHNYTDFWGYPLIRVADDFVLPVFRALNIKTECHGLLFTFTTIRLKVDHDPYSITIQLFNHNYTRNTPQNTPLFSRTMCSPDNTCKWPTRLNVPLTTTITLNNGDMGDDGVSLFDVSLLPQSTTLWVSIYVTVPDHPSTSILRENSLYWMSLDNRSTSTPVEALFYNETPNYHYQYIDVNNLHRNGFTSWTDATIVQPVLGVQTSTFNLAYTATLLCREGVDMTILPTTEAPSGAPTIATEAPTVLTRAPTTQTRVPTSATPIPTYAPTEIQIDNTTTETPTWEEALNRTNGTIIVWYDPDMIPVALWLSIPLSIIVLIFVILICLRCYSRCRRRGPLNIGNYLRSRKKDDREIEMMQKGAIETSYRDYKDNSKQEVYEGLDSSEQKYTVHGTWTSDSTYSIVPIDESETEQNPSFENWVNNTVPQNQGVIHRESRAVMI